MKKLLLTVILFIFILPAFPENSYANSACCTCRSGCDICNSEIRRQADFTRRHMTNEFINHRNWLIIKYFPEWLRVSLMLMTHELTVAAMMPMGMIGSFFDAKQQLETQRLLDQKYNQALKEFQPGVPLCTFSTLSLPLASSEQRSSVQKTVMTRAAISRHLGNQNTLGRLPRTDMEGRIRQFRNVYCNPEEMRGNVTDTENSICGEEGAPDEDRYFRDINITKTLDMPKTLDINLTDTTMTEAEEDIFALARNLYGHEVFPRPTADELAYSQQGGEVDYSPTSVQEIYLKTRSVVAKRQVAENSFFNIAAMKAKGTGISKDYYRQMLMQLGLKGADVAEIFGEDPSYYAQMEVLTKKLYQDPSFIAGLIDKPQNVKRQKVAMKAFSLMQQRDTYHSLLRQEQIMSVILDEYLRRRFNRIEQFNIQQAGESALVTTP